MFIIPAHHPRELIVCEHNRYSKGIPTASVILDCDTIRNHETKKRKKAETVDKDEKGRRHSACEEIDMMPEYRNGKLLPSMNWFFGRS